MRVHGFMSTGELIAAAVLVICAIGVVVFAFVAGVRSAFGWSSLDWWSYAGFSGLAAFVAWLFL